MENKNKIPYHEKVANKIIESIENGTASFTKPWKAGEFQTPHNPSTGKPYTGINMINLSCSGRDDTRWCTYNQAADKGWNVRKGEKATTIQYWKFEERRKVLDKDNKPVKDDNGKDKYQMVKLDRPKVFYANVFNAEQMDNVPKLEPKPITWDANERAETILENSGAKIEHDQSDRAFYSPVRDKIHLPAKSNFDSQDSYYETAMHELGHWTGHSSRLDRDLSNPFGSQEYAREELRAEISSFMVNSEVGLARDPSNHAGYVESWVKLLQDEPMEIFRASREANEIKNLVLGFEQKLEQSINNDNEVVNKMDDKEAKIESALPENLATEETFLSIPYNDKERAKKAAGKLPDGQNAIGWDKENSSWFAKKGADLNKLKEWTDPVVNVEQQTTTPEEEFRDFLVSKGLEINGLPEMDGQIHRVKVEGDKGSQKSGSYVGHLDGHPAGFVQNFKSDIKENWSMKGYTISPQERAYALEKSKEQRKKREAERQKKYEHNAKRSQQLFSVLKPAINNEYALKKGIDVTGAKQDKKGRLVVPFRNQNGDITTVQRISGNGFKQFKKGSQKTGSFHLLNPDKTGEKTAILAEGYSTGQTIAKATGLPVYVCADSGNLNAVAKNLSQQNNNKTYIVAGDDDRNNEKKNVGREKAIEASKILGTQPIFPSFVQDGKSQGTDFNDLAKESGLSEVRRQLQTGISFALEQQRKETLKQQQRKKQSITEGRKETAKRASHRV